MKHTNLGRMSMIRCCCRWCRQGWAVAAVAVEVGLGRGWQVEGRGWQVEGKHLRGCFLLLSHVLFACFLTRCCCCHPQTQHVGRFSLVPDCHAAVASMQEWHAQPRPAQDASNMCFLIPG